MSQQEKMIGLFGGTFDPPHVGHVALAEAALEKMGFDEVWVMPAEPVHRELSGCADGAMRLGWLEAIFAAEPRIEVSDRELRRGRSVSTIETLRELAAEGITPWLLMGADAWNGLPTWQGYPEHRERCNIAVFARSGVDTIARHDGWQPVALDAWREMQGRGHLCSVDCTLPDISATEIRRRAASGEPLDGLVPDIVKVLIARSYRSRE